MKIALQDGHDYILRFDRGEELLSGLAAFMEQNSIQACSFTAIGSCSDTELGYYNPNLKQYRKKLFLENMEVITVTGTGAMLEGKAVLHAHGLFGRTDFNTVGGHVFKLITLATCEVSLTSFTGTLSRAHNPEFNLNLLQEQG